MNAVRQEDHAPISCSKLGLSQKHSFRFGSMEAKAAIALLVKGGTVLKSAYGKPFSEKSLTGMIRHWTLQAGIPEGYTLHGLRRRFSPKQYFWSAVLNRGQSAGEAWAKPLFSQ
ncbi:hypothetical protein MPLSOD_140672 [Mesorhizobium sp. SOD10]|nr:hypothetical protein MPLSOD_140672 [Mesorhizobium sp. SOD10]